MKRQRFRFKGREVEIDDRTAHWARQRLTNYRAMQKAISQHIRSGHQGIGGGPPGESYFEEHNLGIYTRSDGVIVVIPLET